MKAHFIQAIENLKNMIAEIAAAVEKAVHTAVEAVELQNENSAQTIISNDTIFDNQEILIEEECLKILALYQPVAGDLRQVITILKINNEIERIADLAVNIAERVPDMSCYNETSIEKFDFCAMVNIACNMLKESLDAMAYHDVVLAAEVIQSDDKVDDIHRENYEKVKNLIIKYPAQSGYYMDCLTVSRCLERIADIATNIAEDVIYLESGKIVRHAHEEINHGK